MAEHAVGSRISLISKSEIRYEGFLHFINPDENTVGLKNVRMYGTEGRKGQGHEVPAGDQLYEFIIFRGADIKDLTVFEDKAPRDPAIVSAKPQQQPPQPPVSTATAGASETYADKARPNNATVNTSSGNTGGGRFYDAPRRREDDNNSRRANNNFDNRRDDRRDDRRSDFAVRGNYQQQQPRWRANENDRNHQRDGGQMHQRRNNDNYNSRRDNNNNTYNQRRDDYRSGGTNNRDGGRYGEEDRGGFVRHYDGNNNNRFNNNNYRNNNDRRDHQPHSDSSRRPQTAQQAPPPAQRLQQHTGQDFTAATGQSKEQFKEEFDFAKMKDDFEKNKKEFEQAKEDAKSTTRTYDKTTFFDNISCETKDRADAKGIARHDREEQKRTDTETFGSEMVGAMRGFRHGGRGRGGRGRFNRY